ncbi:MAG: hypothetical protein AVDCRST_MAG69-1728, partial [uncultured Solirubrobacteraceae bacterium]
RECRARRGRGAGSLRLRARGAGGRGRRPARSALRACRRRRAGPRDRAAPRRGTM